MIEMLHENKKFQKIEYLKMVFKGAMDYYSNNVAYSEENFFIYRHLREGSLIYESELLTRLESGELLKIIGHYKINKELIPEKVEIDKIMGKQIISETFKMNLKSNIITYQFQRGEVFNEYKITPPPRFQIATPTSTTSALFLYTKKYDPTGKNFNGVLVSDNFWEYQTIPSMQYILAQRQGSGLQTVKIKGKELKAFHYKLFTDEDHIRTGHGSMDVYMSKHYGIPYLMQYEDIKIQVRYLNEVSAGELGQATA